jgi:hypothetical protein
MIQILLKKGIHVLFLVLLVACTPAAAAPAPAQEARLKDLESKAEMISAVQLDLTSLRFKVNQLSGDQAAVKEMQSRLDGLQQKVDTLAAQNEAIPSTGTESETANNAFNVAMVQYVLDSAGLHEISAELDKTKKVNPAYLEKVNRAKKVLAIASLPPELAEQNKSLIGLLDQLSAALEADKGEEAAELAKKAHGAQHGYTKAIDGWLSTAGTK